MHTPNNPAKPLLETCISQLALAALAHRHGVISTSAILTDRWWHLDAELHPKRMWCHSTHRRLLDGPKTPLISVWINTASTHPSVSECDARRLCSQVLIDAGRATASRREQRFYAMRVRREMATAQGATSLLACSQSCRACGIPPTTAAVKLLSRPA